MYMQKQSWQEQCFCSYIEYTKCYGVRPPLQIKGQLFATDDFYVFYEGYLVYFHALSF